MFYERKIKYLDYLVNREKCGSAGFIKLEVRGTTCNITINISIPCTEDSLPVKVFLIGGDGDRELCSLELVHGKGMKLLPGQEAQDIGGTGISYEALLAVRIPISPEREINGVIGDGKILGKHDDISVSNMWNECQKQGEIRQDKRRIEWEKTKEAIYKETIYKEIETTESELQEENRVISEPETKAEIEEQPVGQVEAVTEIQTAEAEAERRVPLYDDKWKQLWAIYPHISPFRDEREYLSVGPGDFVILPAKYFRMANNSFLLHGYYNYKHLVLKKMEHRGETRYYIGVPGNFYDREKQVAIMFGFENFESQEEPARAGDYGYYLMRIEL